MAFLNVYTKALKYTVYSSDCLSAAAVARGVITRDPRRNPPINMRCWRTGKPLTVASMAAAPKINIGNISGMTSNDKRTPPRRAPNIIAAPAVPIRLIAGVPSAMVVIRTL